VIYRGVRGVYRAVRAGDRGLRAAHRVIRATLRPGFALDGPLGLAQPALRAAQVSVVAGIGDPGGFCIIRQRISSLCSGKLFIIPADLI